MYSVSNVNGEAKTSYAEVWTVKTEKHKMDVAVQLIRPPFQRNKGALDAIVVAALREYNDRLLLLNETCIANRTASANSLFISSIFLRIEIQYSHRIYQR